MRRWAAKTSLLLLCAAFGCGPAVNPPPAAGERAEVASRPSGRFALAEDGFVARGDGWAARASAELLSVSLPGAEETPLRLGRALARRGTTELGVGAVATGVSAEGALRLARAGLEEELRSCPEGLSQSWHFPTRPAGDGALELRLPLRAGRFVSGDEAGLRFAAGDDLLRYGHGTWIDAEGRRTAVPARFEEGAIVLRVPAALLEASEFPAVLDPVISAVIRVGEVVLVPPGWISRGAGIASNGRDSLVAWAGARGPEVAANGVFAGRVSAAGELLEPGGISISVDSMFSVGFVDVASDGQGWLVAWSDTGPGRVRFASRVDATGMLLDAVPLVLPQGHCTLCDSFASWDGTNYVLAGRSTTGASPINFVRISPAGALLDPAGVPLATNFTVSGEPRVVGGAGRSLVLWSGEEGGTSGSWGAIVSDAGQVESATPLLLEAGARTRPIAAAWNGTEWLVLIDRPFACAAGLVSVDALGVVVPRPDLPADEPDCELSEAALVWTGASWAVISSEVTIPVPIRAKRLAIDGSPIDASWVPLDVAYVPTGASVDAAAGAGGTIGVVYASIDFEQGSGETIYATMLAPDLSPAAPAPLPMDRMAQAQHHPAVVWTGGHWLTSWTEARPGERRRIHIERLAHDGSRLDGVDHVLSEEASGDAFSLATSGGDSLIVSSRASRSVLHAVRIDDAGTVLDPTPIVLGESVAEPAAVFEAGANGWLVLWTRRVGATSELRATRVDRTGAVLDPQGVLLDAESVYAGSPRASWDGARHVVVWQRAAGSVLMSRPLDWGAVLPGPANLALLPSPAVAISVRWDGASHRLLAAREGCLWSLPLDADGAPLAVAPAQVFGTCEVVYPVTTVYVGGGYFALWYGEPEPRDLFVGQLDASGVALPAPPLLLDRAPLFFNEVAAASDGAGTALVLYEAFDRGVGVNGERVIGRLVDLQEPPVASPASVATDEDHPLPITLTADDPDGDPLVFELTSLPAHGVLQGEPPALVYQPAQDFTGLDSFTFLVRDAAFASPPVTVSIEVRPVDDAPAFVAPTPLDRVEAEEANPLQFVVAARDPDGDVLTLSAPVHPVGATFDGATGRFDFTPGFRDVGRHALVFEVTDGTSSVRRVLILSVSSRDTDGDGVSDGRELQAGTSPEASDSDADGIDDATELGDPEAPFDSDGDGLLDALDTDSDDDGRPDALEAGDADPATPPRDTDGDGVPDARDLDSDGDGASDDRDRCPLAADPAQADLDGDALGDACDDDDDGDGVADDQDRCPRIADPAQTDLDGDALGDACDPTDDRPAPTPPRAAGDGDDGGGCSSAGGGSGGLFGLGLALLLARRGRASTSRR